jgi:2-phospho-L-lactate guanylyltransferase
MHEIAVFRPWALIPAKAFGRAKSRLAGVLGVRERRELARSMFEGVLSACIRCEELCGILVATDGEDTANLAARRGISVLRDRAAVSTPLSAIVDAGLAWLATREATHALVVMGDLPQLRTRDVRELLAQLRGQDMVLAADGQRRGTSALGLRLALGLRTSFGHSDSMQRHLREAERLRANRRVLHNPRVALDLDTPADLEHLTEQWKSSIVPWSSVLR